jgi:hypothetical protein
LFLRCVENLSCTLHDVDGCVTDMSDVDSSWFLCAAKLKLPSSLTAVPLQALAPHFSSSNNHSGSSSNSHHHQQQQQQQLSSLMCPHCNTVGVHFHQVKHDESVRSYAESPATKARLDKIGMHAH